MTDLTFESIGREHATLVRRRAMLLADLDGCQKRMDALTEQIVTATAGQLWSEPAAMRIPDDVVTRVIDAVSDQTEVFDMRQTPCPGTPYCQWATQGDIHIHTADGGVWAN